MKPPTTKAEFEEWFRCTFLDRQGKPRPEPLGAPLCGHMRHSSHCPERVYEPCDVEGCNGNYHPDGTECVHDLIGLCAAGHPEGFWRFPTFWKVSPLR